MSRPILLAEALAARLRVVPRQADDCIALGDAAVDARLGGGIARGALHEIYAASEDDASAAAGFALMLAIAAAPDRPVVWVRDERGARRTGLLYAPGLVDLGIDAGTVLLVMVDDERAVLRAADDIVRHGGAGAVVVEPSGRAPALDLTASRRLAMAAGRGGLPAIILRIGAEPAPSAAQTRWRVAAAPSFALDADAPGAPAFDISLLRHRSGLAGFDARLEWNRDTRSFAPVSGRRPAAAPVRASPARTGPAPARQAA